MFSTNLSGWWVGFGCGWAKLNVVFLGRQVRWQNTSFNFAKRWLFCLFFVGLSMFVGCLLALGITQKYTKHFRTQKIIKYFSYQGF
jgi:hypothetical protein